MNKKTLTPIILAGIFFLMLGLSFAAVPLYDLFCRVTGFGGTTQNAEYKEIPKIVVNKNYKIRINKNPDSMTEISSQMTTQQTCLPITQQSTQPTNNSGTLLTD